METRATEKFNNSLKLEVRIVITKTNSIYCVESFYVRYRENGIKLYINIDISFYYILFNT